MSDSSAYSLQLSIEDLKKLQTDLQANGTDFETAIKLCNTIANELEDSNPTLAEGWRSIADNLDFLSDNLASRVGEIYSYIDNQMTGIAQSEQLQTQTVNEYIAQGNQLIQELMNAIGTVVTDPAVLNGVSETTSGVATSLASGITSTTRQLTPIISNGIVNTTNAVVPLVADGINRGTELVTTSMANRIGARHPESAAAAQSFATGITTTTQGLTKAFSDGITSTTSQITPILADQIVGTTEAVVPILTNGFTTTTQSLLQAGAAAARSARASEDVI